MDKTIKFSHNLQKLRKRQDLSQEQLAERLDLSRQSVSKWESGEAYPEMKVLLNLCEIFHVGLDDLIHGDIEIRETPLRAKYEKVMHRQALLTSLGIGLILAGTTLFMMLQSFLGEDDQLAPLSLIPVLAMTAVAVVLFIVSNGDADAFKARHQSLPAFYSHDEVDSILPKYRTILGLGIGIIIVGTIPMMATIALYENGPLSIALLLGFVTIGVPLIIYASSTKDSYDIAGYNFANSYEQKELHRKIGICCGLIMLVATNIYLTLAYTFNAWGTAWAVFPIGGILCGIVSTYFRARPSSNSENK